MAKKKKAEGKKGLDEWMATYSDMVTLLMCFFVLLYASSTPDETKWQYIFQAFTTSGTYINPFVSEEDPYDNDAAEEDGNSMTPASSETANIEDGVVSNMLPENFDDFTMWFASAVSSSDYADDVSVEQSSSTRITIRFSDSVMFSPDSAVLLDSGKDVISLMLPGIKAINEYIKSIEVSGHTSEGISAVNDWDLSSARACSVVKYIDFKRVIDSDVFVAEGFGPYQPIDLTGTSEGLAKNRRVELVLVRNDVAISDSAIIGDILQYDYGINHGVTDPEPGASNSDAVTQIIEKLEDKYQTDIASDGTVLGEESGPSPGSPITEIPDSALHELDEEGNIITETAETDEADSSAEEE